MTALIRTIEAHQEQGFTICCMDGEDCQRTPEFIVATPFGEMGFCDYHVSEIVAMLPQEWTDQWIRPAPLNLESADGIPF